MSTTQPEKSKGERRKWGYLFFLSPFAFRLSPYPRRAVAALAQDPNVSRWSGQSLSSGQLAKVYGFTDLDGSQPDAWRYIVEVQDAGKPADVTGYR
jgi:hypothetical protein